MCGINLIIRAGLPCNGEEIRKMNEGLHHRGPDARHAVSFSCDVTQYFLGSTRLRVTDPSSLADQPICSADGRFYLSLNGEIYNHLTLRKELKNKSFSTHSDVETLLYGLIEQGEAFLPRLNGMFAFVFVDRETGNVLLARDPAGIKTLYYYAGDRIFVASSEARNIFLSGLVRKELNERPLFHYLRFRYVSGPETFYQNVFEVPPGMVFKIDSSGQVLEKNFFTPSCVGFDFSGEEAIANLKVLLQEVMTDQFPQEAASGILLSGGVDSSLLLSLMAESGIRHYPVFTLTHKKEETTFGTEDYKYARKAANLFSGELVSLDVDCDFLDTFPDFLEAVDFPVADPGGWATWGICRKARESVKVLFSGAGADEYFAGYNRHKAFHLYLSIAPLATPLFKKLAVFPETLPGWKNLRLGNKFIHSLEKEPEKTWQNFKSLSSFDSGFVKNPFIREKRFNPKEDYLLQALEDDRQNYLISDVLRVTDQYSMSSSMEVRVPYLDFRIIHFARQFSASELLKNGPKWMLKSILKSQGSAAIARRKKEGFTLPLGKWLLTEKGEDFLRPLTKKESVIFEYIYFDPVKKLLEEQKRGMKNLSSEIFALLLLNGWLEREF